MISDTNSPSHRSQHIQQYTNPRDISQANITITNHNLSRLTSYFTLDYQSLTKQKVLLLQIIYVRTTQISIADHIFPLLDLMSGEKRYYISVSNSNI
jgi:hypothetical protein